MQESSAFQFLAIDTVHESTTNPRRTFEEGKLHELAESIRQHGLIQPITVRPNQQGFEIVAGARRYRAAQLAELFAVPARIVDIDDGQALEWQLVENSQRVDVHPYEEAQGFARLLDMPGYDVAAIAEKSGKSPSHIYARLSLLQLIPSVAEAFTQERITASHANLIARLPHESQAAAFEQCWRKDWQDKEPHLLPAKHLAAWVQTNLYLPLADAPFDREDPNLNPAAGACTTCPRRSGFNTSLFCDVQGDQCLDAPCYHTKVNAHIDREIAARPELIQIENTWRPEREQRPGAVQRGRYLEVQYTENPDAEPAPPCPSAKSAIVVFGKRVGNILTVCAEKFCPVHNPHPTAEPVVATAATVEATEIEPQPETEGRLRQREEQEAERERLAEQRREQYQRQQSEEEAEYARREAVREARAQTFERILAQAPTTFTSPQLRVVLRALVNQDPYTLLSDLAEEIAAEQAEGEDDGDRGAEELLLTTISQTEDDKLTRFALRLVLTPHIAIPHELETDLLAEAEAVFASPKPHKTVTEEKKQVKKRRSAAASAKVNQKAA